MPIDTLNHTWFQRMMERTAEEEWSCARTGGGVTCYNARGKITPRLIVHEFGHVFNAHLVNSGLANPYEELSKATIMDAEGRKVQGINEKGVWERSFSGYVSDRASGVYHGKEYSDWNSPGEDFADMYMNWVFDTFSTDLAGAGAARCTWMETHMAVWLDLIP